MTGRIPWGRRGYVVTVDVAVGARDIARAVEKVLRMLHRRQVKGVRVVGVWDLYTSGQRSLPREFEGA